MLFQESAAPVPAPQADKGRRRGQLHQRKPGPSLHRRQGGGSKPGPGRQPAQTRLLLRLRRDPVRLLQDAKSPPFSPGRTVTGTAGMVRST